MVNHSQNSVVHNNCDDRQVLTDRSTSLIEIHMKRAVTCDMNDSVLGTSHLCANGRTVAESHGAQASAGNELLGFVMFEILGCPHLVLSNISNINRIFIGHITNGR